MAEVSELWVDFPSPRLSYVVRKPTLSHWERVPKFRFFGMEAGEGKSPIPKLQQPF